MIRKQSEKKICAFCKLGHRVYLKKEVSVFDAVVMLTITGILAFAIWGEPDLRSLLIFMTLSFLLQVFLRIRYRESVKCPHCGFDPILHQQNQKMAAKRVNEFMEARKDNPEFLLKPRPRIEPIYLSKDQIQIIEKEQALEEAASSAQLGQAAKVDRPPTQLI